MTDNVMATNADRDRGQVFFVDDERDVCAAVKETLEDSDIKARCFIHPSECLAELRRGRCDLLITDLKMSEKNGIELLKEARERAPWVPVLIVTGYGDVPTAVKAMKCGAVDFMEKPLEKDRFVRKVKLFLERSRMFPLDGFRALTRMEMKVLQLIVMGESNKDVAQTLNRAVRTVEAHRARLMRKLGVHNMIELIKLVSAVGLVDLAARRSMIQDGLQVENRPNDVPRTRE